MVTLLEAGLVAGTTFLLGYMLILIRDLDNPFEYDGGKQAGAAEVSLAPLEHVRRRLEPEVAEVTSSAASMG